MHSGGPQAPKGDFLHQLVFVGDATRRLLSMQDTDPLSPSHGNFHCAYWRDKTSEFADARYQEAGAALGLLSHPAFHQLGASRGWPTPSELMGACHAALAQLRRLQYPEGCYDEWYKGERGFAATAFTTLNYAACAVELGPAMPDETTRLVQETLEPAAGWLSRRDDLVKVNHQVAAAAALAAFHRLTGKACWRAAALDKLRSAVATQTAEGWFPELDGMDFGYSALVLDLLMHLHRWIEAGEALSAATRLANFLLPHMHPDVTFAAEAGTCRNRFAGQAGFLLLAPYHPSARAVAARLAAMEPGASETRILAYLGDDLRLARWSTQPLLAALAFQTAPPLPAADAELPVPAGWTIHDGAGVAAFHRGDLHVHIPFGGSTAVRAFAGGRALPHEHGSRSPALSIAAGRIVARTPNAIDVLYEQASPRYLFPGFLSRLLLRLGSCTAPTSRLTRWIIDRYRLRARTAINQAATAVAMGGDRHRFARRIEIGDERINVTEGQATSLFSERTGDPGRAAP